MKPGKGLLPVATTIESRHSKEKEKEQEEKVELQNLVDSLSADQFTTLIKMWRPDVDENVDDCLVFGKLSKKERVRFRAILEQLLAKGPKEKKPEKKQKKAHTNKKTPQKNEKQTHTKTGVPQPDPKGSQKANSKDAEPAKPAMFVSPMDAPKHFLVHKSDAAFLTRLKLCPFVQ